MFSFPDLSKMQALFEEGLQSFAQVQADVKEIKAQQAEILLLLATPYEVRTIREQLAKDKAILEEKKNV